MKFLSLLLLLAGSLHADLIQSRLEQTKIISEPGFSEFRVDGVLQLLLCDNFDLNVPTFPYLATVNTLQDLEGTLLQRNGDPQALQKYLWIAILDLGAYADPSKAPDTVSAIRAIAKGTLYLRPGAQELLDWVKTQNANNYNLSGFRIYANPDFQEQTGFVPVPEPGGWRFSLLIGLLTVALIGNHQHRHAARKARRFTPLESQ